jgi:hypothetical protein
MCDMVDREKRIRAYMLQQAALYDDRRVKEKYATLMVHIIWKIAQDIDFLRLCLHQSPHGSCSAAFLLNKEFL